MQCMQCNYRNAGTLAYCQKCGAKMDFTADQIQGSLVETAKEETARSTDFYARQGLLFAAVLFLLAGTLFVLSGGAPGSAARTPSAAQNAGWLKVEFIPQPELPKPLIPLEAPKK